VTIIHQVTPGGMWKYINPPLRSFTLATVKELLNFDFTSRGLFQDRVNHYCFY
jgi:hypothetical protein